LRKSLVAEPAPPRPGAILLDGQGLDVTDAPPVEITAGRVMDGVLAPPPRKRRVQEHAQHRAQPLIHTLGAHERAVGAVVEDNERPDQESGRWNRQRQHEQVREPEGSEHHRHHDEVRDGGSRHVEDG
jgi:hypothetical protein